MKAALFFRIVFMGISLALAACAPAKVAGPTQEEGVMAAQYAAKRSGEAPGMQGAESDAIYKNYLENIGKPLETNDGRTGVQSR